MTGPETIYVQYSSLIGQLIRKLNVLNREQKVCYGLTLSQCYTIETLGQRGNRNMKELSHDMGVSISSMTRVVDVLVRDDILTRQENPNDRREVRITLTEKGLDLFAKLKQCSETYSKAILDLIPREKRQMVLKSLELTIEAINQVKLTCCLPHQGASR